MASPTEVSLITLWLLLPDAIVGEFSFLYDKNYKISIRGVWNSAEYVISLSIHAMPYMAYGCNQFHTGMKSRTEIIRYFLMEFVNRMSPYNTEGLKEIIGLIKSL